MLSCQEHTNKHESFAEMLKYVKNAPKSCPKYAKTHQEHARSHLEHVQTHQNVVETLKHAKNMLKTCGIIQRTSQNM